LKSKRSERDAPTKNGKEIFGFASPLPNSVYHNMQSLGIAIQHIR